MEIKKEELVKVAKELNEVLGLDPQIKIRKTMSLDDLKAKIIEAAGLIEPEDELSLETTNIVHLLTGTGQEFEPEEEEEEPKEARDEKEEKEEEKEEKEVDKKKGNKKQLTSNYQGAMTQFIDQLLFAGGTWEEILKAIKEEVERRGIDAKTYKKYTIGMLRQHINYRIKQGFPTIGHREVEMTDKEVHVRN